MRKLLILNILVLSLYGAGSARADDVDLADDEEPAYEGGGDLGNAACPAIERAIREYDECVNRPQSGGANTKTGIYNCGRRPVLPPRCR